MQLSSQRLGVALALAVRTVGTVVAFDGGEHRVVAGTDRLIADLIAKTAKVVGFHEAPETPLAA